jgi:hypothetical protein
MTNELSEEALGSVFYFSGGCVNMRSKCILCVVLGLAAVGFAKDPKPYLTGKLTQMDSVQCGVADSGGKQTQQPLCQEYVLQADRVTYRIRPRDEKHSALLPVGESAEFRLQKDKMLLRIEALDSKEHEYIVVSKAPRSDGSSADATPIRLNHLQ